MQVLGFTHNKHNQPLPIMAVADRLRDLPNLRLRWGGAMQPNAINGTCSLLNGLEQLKRFTAQSIPTISYTVDVKERDRWVSEGWRVLGRKLNHTQGFDIITTLDLTRAEGLRSLARSRAARWSRRDYWVKYQPNVGEWRYHVLRDNTGELRTIARGQKTQLFAPTPDMARKIIPGVVIRSRRLGWTLNHIPDPPKGMRALAKQAVQACGYDLGAVDILVLEDGSMRVLEVNSRPAVRDDYTVGKYAEALRKFYVVRS